jgi:hypothetical protein
VLSLPLSAISFIRIAAKVSSNNDTIRRKQKSKNTSDGTLPRECDDETIIFSPRCCCDCWEKLLTVFRKQIFIQDDFNDGATAAEEKVSTLTSTLLFTTNLRRVVVLWWANEY